MRFLLNANTLVLLVSVHGATPNRFNDSVMLQKIHGDILGTVHTGTFCWTNIGYVQQWKIMRKFGQKFHDFLYLQYF